MKILFVNLAGTDDEPPFGYLYMASYLRENGGYRDINILETTFEDAIRDIARINPDIIGLSSTSLFYRDIIRIADKIRRYPGTKNKVIIIGGSHITAIPNSIAPVFDVGVVGEGEETLLEIVRVIDKKQEISDRDLSKIRGICFNRNGKVTITPPRPLIEPLDSLPHPAWDLLDRRYFKRNMVFTTKPVVSASVFTARGCPFKCIFCNSSYIWQKVRFHSAKRIAEEIEFLVRRYNAKLIKTQDDLFTINKPRLRELVAELRDRGILGKIKIISMARTDTLDEETMKLLKELNVIKLNFGFESGSSRVINYLKGAKISLEDHKRAIALCRKYGIKPRGSLIFGSPTETLDEMRQTLKFMDYMWKNGVELVWFHVMTPFPNTKIWEIAKERNKVSDSMDWGKLTLFNPDEPLLLENNISKKEFRKIFLKARAKSRRFEVKYWAQKFIDSPFRTISYLLSQNRFAKFFMVKKKY